jgi:SAM-dependent methyltransferase
MAQYDQVADSYARLVAPKYAPIAGLVVDRLPAAFSGVVVEPGIGTGLLAGLALPRLPGCRRYVGVDVSPGMLALARKALPAWVSLIQASAADLPLADEAADLLVSSLGPVQESDDFFAEAVRVLGRGSSLVIACWGEGYRELDLLQRARERLGCGSYPTGVVNQVRARADRSGLVDVVLEAVRLPVRHDSLDEYLAYRGAFGRMPWLPEGSDDAWQRLLTEEAARYTTAAGHVDLDWTILVLSGRRAR